MRAEGKQMFQGDRVHDLIQTNLQKLKKSANLDEANIIIDPQIIIDPPPDFTVGTRHCGLYVSPGQHLTIR